MTKQSNARCRAIKRDTLSVVGVCLAITAPFHAAAQSVGFELVPAAQYVRWADPLGLEDGYLWGGRVGLNFGPTISVRPFFFTRAGLQGDPANISGTPFPGLASREFDVSHFGADLQLNIGRGGLAPFVRAGGGVLRFDPDQGQRLDQITVKAGGGLSFGLGGPLSGELFAEDWAFRVNRGALYGASGTADPDADEMRHNLVLGGGLSVALGPRAGDDYASSGGLGIPIEPFVGRLDYHDDLNLDRQYAAGVRAGLDLNRLFGVRGFYWRGVSDDFDAVADVSAFGGEAQFTLGAGVGLAPFLVAGAGRLDFADDFRDPSGSPRDDRTMLILGGGISLGLTEHLRMQIAARDYVFSETAEIEDVLSTDELLHNMMLSAGLSFRLGASRPDRVAIQAPPLSAEEIERIRENTRRRADEPVAGGDPRGAMPAPPPGTREDERALRADEIRLAVRAAIRDEMRDARLATDPGDAVTLRDLQRLEDRLVDRFDERLARRTSDDAYMRVEAPPVRERAPEAPVPGGMDAQAFERRMDALERRLMDRIDGIERQMDQAIAARLQRPDAITVVPETPAAIEPERRRREWNIEQVRPYLGVNINRGTQLVLGGRLNTGPVTPGSQFDLVPEVAFGVGEGSTTVLVAGNLQYSLGEIAGTGVVPFVSGGGGVFSETVLALNAGYGAALDLRPGGRTMRAFVEHQGINLFTRNRFLAGARLQF